MGRIARWRWWSGRVGPTSACSAARCPVSGGSSPRTLSSAQRWCWLAARSATAISARAPCMIPITAAASVRSAASESARMIPPAAGPMNDIPNFSARRIGRLLGLGVGPGDPELITLKALRLLQEAPVVAYPVAKGGASNALGIVAGYLRPEQIRLALVYPVPTKKLPPPFCYETALRDFYDDSCVT